MTQIFETIMLICFGISWPISVVKSIKSRSAKGKSLVVTIAIIIGYCAGIAGKICSGAINYVFWLYILNLAVVTLDLIISIINIRRDDLIEKNSKKAEAIEVKDTDSVTSVGKKTAKA